jgi:hypothetical protein
MQASPKKDAHLSCRLENDGESLGRSDLPCVPKSRGSPHFPPGMERGLPAPYNPKRTGVTADSPPIGPILPLIHRSVFGGRLLSFVF